MSKKILFYSPFGEWYLHTLYELTIGHALKLRGNEVKFVGCDAVFTDCDQHKIVSSPRTHQSCTICQEYQKQVFNNLQMPIEWLGTKISEDEKAEAKEWAYSLQINELLKAKYKNYPLGEWVESSIHTFFRVKDIDTNDVKIMDSYRSHLYSAALTLISLTAYINDFNPDALFLLNGRFYSHRVAFELARERDINVYVHERGLTSYNMRIYENETVETFDNLLKSWENWKDIPLNIEEIKKVEEIVDERSKGITNWRSFVKADKKEWQMFYDKLNIPVNKKIVTLYTSSDDEEGVAEAWLPNIIKQFDWIDRTIEYFKDKPDYVLVIRVHPNIVGFTGTNHQSLRRIVKFKKTVPSYVRVVMPQDEVNSYQLLEVSDAVLTYFSSLTIEAVLWGKPVLVCSKGLFYDKNFAVSLKDAKDYYQELDSLLKSNVENYQLQAAYRYAYHFFIRQCIFFPKVEVIKVHHAKITYKDVNELLPGKDPYLDHICDAIENNTPVIPVPSGEYSGEVEKQYLTDKLKMFENTEKELAKELTDIKVLPNEKKQFAPPKVSVIVTCYNYEHYLKEAVESVLFQTYQDFEVVIVNDGSTDKSKEVAEKLINDYPNDRIILVDQENSGQPAIARNSGIKVANGKYILPLDADDKFKDEMLQECVNVLDKNEDVAFVYTDRHDFDGVDEIVHAGNYNFEVLKYNNFISYCGMYRKEVWGAIGGYRTNIRGMEDRDFWVAAGSRGYFGMRIPIPLFLYRRHDTGVYQDVLNNQDKKIARVFLNNSELYSEEELQNARKILGEEVEPVEKKVNEIPSVCVLMTTYNRENEIADAINSVVEQTFTDWNLIIVNDGGNDVQEIVDSFNDDRIKYFLKEHAGKPAALNFAIKNSQSEYIAYLDDDDRYFPNHLQTLMNRIKSDKQADFVYSASEEVSIFLEKGKWNEKTRKVVYNYQVTPTQLMVNNHIPNLCALHKRELLDKTGLYDEDLEVLIDWDMYRRLAIYSFPKFVNTVTSEFKRKINQQNQTQGQITSLFHKSPVNYYENRLKILKKPYPRSKKFLSLKNCMMFYLHKNNINQLNETLRKFNTIIQSVKVDLVLILDVDLNESLVKIINSIEGFGAITLWNDKNEPIHEIIEKHIKNNWWEKYFLFDNVSQIDAPNFNEVINGTDILRNDTNINIENENKEIVKNNDTLPKVGLLSYEPENYACPQIRVISHFKLMEQLGNVKWHGLLVDNNGIVDFNKASKLDIIIIQRNFIHVMPFKKLKEHFKKDSPLLIYEFDDAFGHFPENHFMLQQVKQMQPEFYNYLKGADIVTVSSSNLKKLYNEYNKNIHVIPNYIDLNIWKQNFDLPGKPSSKVILLFAGTMGHEPDLNIIKNDLLRILSEFKSVVELYLWGNHDKELEKLGNVKYISEFNPNYMEYAKYLKSLNVDIALVPLANNQFNKAKSYIKWLEYSVCKIAGVYSTMPAYKKVIRSYENGVLASGKDEWYFAIKKLVQNEKLRKEIALSANVEVKKYHDITTGYYQWLAVIKKSAAKKVEIVNKPLVSIVMPVFNKPDFTEKSVCALYKNTKIEQFELIIVDNGSDEETDKTLSDLKNKFEKLRVLKNEKNLGFAVACNQGARLAACDNILFLNNDTEPLPGWLDALIEITIEKPDFGAVGAKLVYPDMKIQHAGVDIVKDTITNYEVSPWHRGYNLKDTDGFNVLTKVKAVTAACMLVSKQNFIEVDGFDEAYWNGYEDVDFCFKLIEKGYHIYYQPKCKVIHYESQSGIERQINEGENFVRLQKIWNKKITADVIRNKKNQLFPYDFASIIIVTYNSAKTIEKCLKNVKKYIRPHDEVVVVDNQSQDETISIVEKILEGNEQYKLIKNNDNLGFTAGTNIGVENSKNPYIVFLNPDVYVTEGWLTALISKLWDYKNGAVGPVSNYVAGLQKADFYLKDKVKANTSIEELAAKIKHWNTNKVVDTKLLTGFCLAMRRDIIHQVGMLDEKLFLGNDDLEFCWRLRLNGFKLLVATDTFVYHEGQVSFKTVKKSKTDQLVQESTDTLYKKLQQYYGNHNVPSPMEVWGMNWFEPTTPEFNPNAKFEDVKMIPGNPEKEEISQKSKAKSKKLNEKLVSIVMLTYNQLEYTRQCLVSLQLYTQTAFELIIVDNGSTDGTIEYLEHLKKSEQNVNIILNKENLGFPKGCNQGMEKAKGDFILLLNNDVVVTTGWLEKLLTAFEKDPQLGILGPMTNAISGPQKEPNITYKNMNEMQEFAGEYSKKHDEQMIYFPRIVGFAMLMKKEVFEKVGYMEESFGSGNYEDDDYCLRAELAGYKMAIVKDVFIHHYGSVSFRTEGKENYLAQLNTNSNLFYEKWKDLDKPVLSWFIFLLNKAQSEKTENKLEYALELFEKAFSIKQDEKILVEDYSELLVQFQQFEKAIEVLSAYIKQKPNDHEAINYLGSLYWQAGDLENARINFEKTVTMTSEHVEYFRNLADLNLAEDKFEDAIRLLSLIIQKIPGDAEASIKLSHLMVEMNKVEDAKEILEKANDVHSDNEELKFYLECLKEPLQYLAYAFINDGKLDLAFEAIEEFLIKNQDNIEALLIKASILFFNNQPQDAKQIYDLIIELDEKNVEAIFYLAKIAFQNGDTAEFERINEENVTLFLKNIELRKMSIEILIFKEDFENAIVAIDSYLGDYKEDYYGYFVMGNIYEAMNENEKALNFYNITLEKNPDEQQVLDYIFEYVEKTKPMFS